ncbi:MAG: preprotein translocase subunit SecA [Candidatus Delongbacteria bacterium]
MFGFLKSIFGGKTDRRAHTLATYQPDVDKINQIYAALASLTDEQLQAKTGELRQRLQDGASTEDILHEAYAVVKDACRRNRGVEYTVMGKTMTWDMVPYDVQLIGAIALHRGGIAEMATGEGKTLVAVLPMYLNALTGRGAHLVTVNDYLAQRDSEWMGLIYRWLGMSVGVILNGQDPVVRKSMYLCDICYGTNNEMGFDYLRDNMVLHLEDRVQRDYHFAIVDEVDSVLIDEARTPLIIAGPVDKSTHKFNELKEPVRRLVDDQFQMTQGLIREARDLWKSEKDNDRYEAGIRLLLAQRSAPKLAEFMDIAKEEGIKRMITRVENDYLREKRLHELDAELFFSIDERGHTIDLQEKGRHKLAMYTSSGEEMFVIPDLSTELVKIDEDPALGEEERLRLVDDLNRIYGDRSERIHNISQLLRAFTLYEKDVEYVVQDGKVQIVDEFTGRILHGRRFSDGLHQALEAKEGVNIERETQTVASITLQNFFRMYERLAGMTGTAATEANEFFSIYKLEVVEIPTNQPVIRNDRDDLIYRTKREKYVAITERIRELHAAKRPVLVGTISVEVSEILSDQLRKAGIPHNVLNAKQHRMEAEIVANAGQPGAVTIATNMAGRGTDIKLGEGVVQTDAQGNKTGGLFILGTERHESRRIDLQLRGRSGRQGDPGDSVFFLSLEDDLMRLFGSERIAGVMDRLGIQEGEVISHSMITNSIGKAQRRVEEQNFAIRKHLIEYDDVMNVQRNTVYARRTSVLLGEDQSNTLEEMIDDVLDTLVEKHCDPPLQPEDWSWVALRQDLLRILLINLVLPEEEMNSMAVETLREKLRQLGRETYTRKRELLGPELMPRLERFALLTAFDRRWKSHLAEMDELKAGIGFQAYAQKNPLVEYKKQGLDMFHDMLMGTYEDALQMITRANLEIRQEDTEFKGRGDEGAQTHHQEAGLLQSGGSMAPKTTSREELEAARAKKEPIKREGPRVGRNDPCPCGSGKKYKACHGKED